MSRYILTSILALFLCSCTTMPVDIDYDEGVAFAILHKFAWLAATPPKTNNVKVDSDTLLHDRLHDEIENRLIAQGYVKTEPAQADFLVTYRMTVENRTDITNYGGYGYPIGWGGYYGRPYWGMAYAYPQQYTYNYQWGTLTVDMLNPKTQKLIWRGTVSDEMEESASPQKKRRQIASMVAQILQKFPPQKPAQ